MLDLQCTPSQCSPDPVGQCLEELWPYFLRIDYLDMLRGAGARNVRRLPLRYRRFVKGDDVFE